MKEQEFKGVIPPIAEKEKRGKQVKRPKEENYARELGTVTGHSHPIHGINDSNAAKRDGINIPAVN